MKTPEEFLKDVIKASTEVSGTGLPNFSIEINPGSGRLDIVFRQTHKKFTLEYSVPVYLLEAMPGFDITPMVSTGFHEMIDKRRAENEAMKDFKL